MSEAPPKNRPITDRLVWRRYFNAVDDTMNPMDRADLMSACLRAGASGLMVWRCTVLNDDHVRAGK